MKTNVAKSDAVKRQGKVPCHQIGIDKLSDRVNTDITTPSSMVGAT
ncbi:MAG TPA: hypothetical protein H9845_00010 [Candidatus Agathobaculum pullicola]|nr:hypothetical protein [Candidatus Agathobaculum pullicola]